ncbi:MAG: hypothetical protein Q8R11_03645 [bacterium]|nr:hypothetical protein [bacterium]
MRPRIIPKRIRSRWMHREQWVGYFLDRLHMYPTLDLTSPSKTIGQIKDTEKPRLLSTGEICAFWDHSRDAIRMLQHQGETWSLDPLTWAQFSLRESQIIHSAIADGVYTLFI